MSLDAVGAMKAVLSHAKALRSYEVVRTGEFKSPPPPGLTFALWVESGPDAAVGASGLDSTSVTLTLTARSYMPMLHKPEEDIDLRMLGGVDGFLGRINADLTLGGRVRNVDVLGEIGDSLTVQWGYIEIDHKLYRIADIAITLIFNDAWEQGI